VGNQFTRQVQIEKERRGREQAVLVHQLSRGATQNPFRKNRGRLVRVAFHPSKPFFFVATQNAVRVYNLAQQALAKKLVAGSGSITSLAVHPSGDHVITGSEVRSLSSLRHKNRLRDKMGIGGSEICSLSRHRCDHSSEGLI
jgi:WD40 repeat protein